MRNVPDHNNMYSTNTRWPKKIWVSKVKNSNCDVDMLNSSNSKHHIDSSYSNHMTKEINILSYFTYMRKVFSLYSKKKVNYWIWIYW